MGGTKIEAVLLDPQGEVLVRRRVATLQQGGYEAILQQVVELVEALRRRAGRPCAVGIGTPGSLSPRTGLLRNSNTLCLNGKPLLRDLRQRLGEPLVLENDANCFALAEAMWGAARGKEVVFGVILGTGVGGGIVLGGRLHRGPLGIAGEWGHHVLDPSGPNCYCGRRGCVETFLCGPALERRWAELTGRPLPLAEAVRLLKEKPDWKEAREWKGELLSCFGRALGNVVNILDPDAIVLGGGVSHLDFLYREGREALQSQIFGDYREVLLLRNRLGDSAGVLGAAWLAG